MDKYYGWAGTVNEFLKLGVTKGVSSSQYFSDLMQEFLLTVKKELNLDLDIDKSHVDSWKRSYTLMVDTLSKVVHLNPKFAEEGWVVAEYIIPGSPAFRTDFILLLPNGHLYILEFKGKKITEGEKARFLDYINDIECFHSESKGAFISPWLLFAMTDIKPSITLSNASIQIDASTIGKDGFSLLIQDINKKWRESTSNVINPKSWINGFFQPSPNLEENAMEILTSHHLPEVFSERSSNVTNAIKLINDTAEYCKEAKKHAFIVITGVPGAGKTMVALSSISQTNLIGQSLYVTGNGPLAHILTYKLIQQLMQSNFEYTQARNIARSIIMSMPSYTRSNVLSQIVAFDEAQRAWGRELHLLFDRFNKQDWGVLISFIGLGQIIYKKEKGSLNNWLNTAIDYGKDWKIILPSLIEPQIKSSTHGKDKRIEFADCLHLDVVIRSPHWELLHTWVREVLKGNHTESYNLLKNLDKYSIYITANRDIAEQFVKDYFTKGRSNLYGWIGSSKGGKTQKGLRQLFVAKEEPDETKEYIYGSWFSGGCCNLNEYASEFVCQGLELDIALLAWGNDLLFKNESWRAEEEIRASIDHTFNTYKVLLTRARRCLIIWCEDENTRKYLEKCGAIPLV